MTLTKAAADPIQGRRSGGGNQSRPVMLMEEDEIMEPIVAAVHGGRTGEWSTGRDAQSTFI